MPVVIPGTAFAFLKQLSANNNRDWFNANKDKFLQEQSHIERFADALLYEMNKHDVLEEESGKKTMFRIYRDTRFSKDKTPYKTHLGVNFRHRSASAGGVHGPGFYLHLEPGGCFAGGGLWHPEPDALFKVRQAICARPSAWKALRASGLDIEGDALKRVPQGFDAEHPCAEDLKLKDFYTAISFTHAEVTAPDFPEALMGACRRATPLVAFLCKAMELPF
jgi:uncharacterized protein (TIGR02453 family)